jgi:phosphohistidine swiveling domain-containing protein
VSYFVEICSPGSSFSIPSIGGKGFGLQKLANNNFLIPRTFVLQSQFFVDLLKNNIELSIAYNEFLKSCQNSNLTYILDKAKNLQARISSLDLSDYLQINLSSIVEKLPRPMQVAVRSSVALEDGTQHAFAGIFESYLCLTSIEDILRSIKSCFVQCFEQKAVVYALENGLTLSAMVPAIVIQEQINVDIAGVYFTSDPTPSGTFNQGIISYKIGLGDSLMSGTETGATFKVSHNNTEIPQEISAFKECLLELIEAGLSLQKIEAHAQDIEWGIKNGTLYFFQSRPITTLSAIKNRPLTWTRKITEERYPEVVSPLGWSMLLGVFKVNLTTLNNRFGLNATSTDQVAKVINDYVYANDSFFSFPENIQTNIWHQFKYLPKILMNLLSAILIFPIFIMSKFFHKTSIGIKTYFITRIFDAYIFPHAKDIIKRWDTSLKNNIDEFDNAYKNEIDFKNHSNTYNYRNHLENIAFKYMEPDLAIYIIKMACAWMVNTLSKNLFPHESKEYLLVHFSKGLQNNRTLEMNIQLEKLVEHIRGSQQIYSLITHDRLAEALILLQKDSQFNTFLELNGHLTTNWDIRVPTWQEAPENLLPILRAKLLNNVEGVGAKIASAHAEHQVFCNSLFASLSGQPWLTSFLITLIHTLREFMRIDEEHHFYCSRVFKATRHFYQSLANEFIQLGKLTDIDQIFFLTEDEIKRAYFSKDSSTLHFLATKRRALFMVNSKSLPPLTYIGDYEQDETLNQAAALEQSSGKIHFKGDGASHGLTTGRVKIIRSIEDASKICLGDIIVTQSPNPAFTPMYSLASGLVASTGSVLSHGLVSAREYRIPAIVNIPGIDKILKDDQKITINGKSGEVFLEQ